MNLLCILIISFDVIEYITNYFKMLSNYKDAYVIGGGGSLFNNSSWGFYKWYSLNISFSGNNFFDALSAPQVLPYGVYTEAIDAIKYYLNYFNKISLIFIATSIVLNYLTKNNYLKIIPKWAMKNAHHWLILHGRYVCKARNPLCNECGISKFCEFFKKEKIYE